jgi:hypothetical protein
MGFQNATANDRQIHYKVVCSIDPESKFLMISEHNARKELLILQTQLQ